MGTNLAYSLPRLTIGLKLVEVLERLKGETASPESDPLQDQESTEYDANQNKSATVFLDYLGMQANWSSALASVGVGIGNIPWWQI